MGIPFLVVHLTVEPFQRGFFCNDDTIRYPYREDTVSMGLCVAVGVLIPVGTVSIVGGWGA